MYERQRHLLRGTNIAAGGWVAAALAAYQGDCSPVPAPQPAAADCNRLLGPCAVYCKHSHEHARWDSSLHSKGGVQLSGEGRCLQGSLCLKDPHALQPSSRVRCFRHAF